MTVSEAEQLLNALAKKSKQTHDICLLALFCGLRFSEIAKLTWACVDFDNMRLWIKDPKNKHSRWAYLTNRVKKMLKERYQGQAPTELIFVDRKGNPLKRISKVFDRTVAELGLNDGIEDRRQKIVFHSLRHTFASLLVEKGTNLYVVKELLGHEDISMTQRYSHLGDNALRQAANELEKVFNKSKLLEFSQKANQA